MLGLEFDANPPSFTEVGVFVVKFAQPFFKVRMTLKRDISPGCVRENCSIQIASWYSTPIKL